MNISLILYTHTDYKDVWPLFFGQTNQYIKKFKKFIFVNKFDLSIDPEYTQIFYDENLPYTQRVASCLDKIKNQSIIFLHEDMILYDEVDEEKIFYFNDLINCEKIDFIKLIKGGTKFKKSNEFNYLIHSDDEYMVSIQPTICKSNKLNNLFKTCSLNIWDFEKNASSICKKNNYLKCYMASCDNEKQRGSYHWDSKIFPYIATAIVKGKWNYSQYSQELDFLFKKYKIDKTIRGFI